MKVYVAVVCEATDYRKMVDVWINHTSVHLRRDDAAGSVATALVKEIPHLLLRLPMIDLEQVLCSSITSDQRHRLTEFMEKDMIDEWTQDDAAIEYEKGKEAIEAFQEKEMKLMGEQKQKIEQFVNDKDFLVPPMSEDMIPELPEGEYVPQPIIWCIHERELATSEEVKEQEEEDGKKRAKVSST